MKSEILLVIGFVLCVLIAIQHNPLHVPAQLVAANSPPLATTTPAVTAIRGLQQQDSVRIARNPTTLDVQNQNELIRRAARSLRDSPPLEARLRYKINLFGQQISGPGRYLQKGQGTRLSRLEFEFGFGDSSVQIHQFCDGDLLYTLSLAGEKSNLEFVDLRELESLQQQSSAASRVTSWLSVGSLTGLMEQLSTHFEFNEIEEQTLDSIPVVQCKGRWNPLALQRLLEGQPEAEAIVNNEIGWQHLPSHLPHQVTLTLGTDKRFPFFPYRIVFQKLRLVDGALVETPIALLELFEVRQAPNLTDEMFSLPSIDAAPTDSTNFYRKRIQQFTR